MICPNCKQEIENGLNVCPLCGAAMPKVQQPPVQQPPVQQPPVQQPPVYTTVAQPQVQSVNFTGNLKGVLKAFFSNSPTNALTVASKDSSMNWIIMFLATALIYGLMIMLAVKQFITSVIATTTGSVASMFGSSGSDVSNYVNQYISFGRLFIFGVLTSLIASFLLTFGAMIMTSTTSIKPGFNCIANTVAAAKLPITLIAVVNIIIAFIYPLAVFITLIASFIICGALYYVGVQKLARFSKSPFWIYSAVIFVTVIIVVIFVSVFTKSVITSSFDSVSSLSKGLM